MCKNHELLYKTNKDLTQSFQSQLQHSLTKSMTFLIRSMTYLTRLFGKIYILEDTIHELIKECFPYYEKIHLDKCIYTNLKRQVTCILKIY